MGLIKKPKHLFKYAIRKTLWALLRCRLIFAYWLCGIEGVSSILHIHESAYLADILVRYGAIVGSGHDLNSPLLIHNAMKTYSNLTIGKQCHLGKEVFLDLRDKITIEDQVTISMRVTVLTHTDVGHSPLRVKVMSQRQSPVAIKRGAYLGAGAIVLPGVTIGECAVIGAGAVVVADVPAYRVAVGVPARVIRTLDVGRKEG